MNEKLSAKSTMEAIVDFYNEDEKTRKLLGEVCLYLGPYDTSINCKDCGLLSRRIHEFIYNFDDNE